MSIGICRTDEVCPEHGEGDVDLCQDLETGIYWVECRASGCGNQGEAFDHAHDAELSWREIHHGEDHGLAGMGVWS